MPGILLEATLPPSYTGFRTAVHFIGDGPPGSTKSKQGTIFIMAFLVGFSVEEEQSRAGVGNLFWLEC